MAGKSEESLPKKRFLVGYTPTPIFTKNFINFIEIGVGEKERESTLKNFTEHINLYTLVNNGKRRVTEKNIYSGYYELCSIYPRSGY